MLQQKAVTKKKRIAIASFVFFSKTLFIAKATAYIYLFKKYRQHYNSQPAYRYKKAPLGTGALRVDLRLRASYSVRLAIEKT